MKYTDTPPYAPTLMESTRAIGYLIESAIADIIDNSIAANATTVDIDFFPNIFFSRSKYIGGWHYT